MFFFSGCNYDKFHSRKRMHTIISAFEIIKFNKKGNYFERWLKSSDLGWVCWGITTNMSKEKFKKTKHKALLFLDSKRGKFFVQNLDFLDSFERKLKHD